SSPATAACSMHADEVRAMRRTSPRGARPSCTSCATSCGASGSSRRSIAISAWPRTPTEMTERLAHDALEGPTGPQVGAFFDFDGTLIDGYSAATYIQDRARRNDMTPAEAARLERVGDVLTGRVEGPILWGPGKAAAVRRFAGEAGIDLEVSYAYGNGGEDVDFLRTVGHPRPVNPNPALAEVAAHEGWPIRRLPSRKRPGLTSVARTVAAYGGLATAFGAGLGMGLINRSRRDAMNFTLATGSDAM